MFYKDQFAHQFRHRRYVGGRVRCLLEVDDDHGHLLLEDE